jgi:hypothetical protein
VVNIQNEVPVGDMQLQWTASLLPSTHILQHLRDRPGRDGFWNAADYRVTIGTPQPLRCCRRELNASMEARIADCGEGVTQL